MTILNFLMLLFNSGRRARRVFRFFRARRITRRLILLSLIGLGTIFGIAATRNLNMMRRPFQRLFQGVQNTTSAFMPSGVNLANMEFANEITPNFLKKQGNQNQ